MAFNKFFIAIEFLINIPFIVQYFDLGMSRWFNVMTNIFNFKPQSHIMKKNLLQKLVYLIFLSLTLLNCNNERISSTENDDQIDVIQPDDELPQININTRGNTIVDEPKIDATMTIIENDIETFNGNIGIEIRGSSSQLFPKKAFGFETRDAANEDVDVSLLGYPEEEDWILYAPYSDKVLMRNMLIYDLSRDIGRYASRTKFVEVSINGIYNGVYVFMEKLKRDSNRIDINKLDETENSGEDLTGGYILKLDKADGFSELFYDDNNSFTSTFLPNNTSSGQEIHFLYDYPDMDDITPEQKSYISSYVLDFESALASEDFTSVDIGYAAFIDVPSFIDFFILNELSNNVDGYRLSTWLVKDKNEKLKMGPIWDFNLAFGNANYCGGANSNVWAYKFNERCPGDFWVIPFWWERLLEDPAFVFQLQQRWNDLRTGMLSDFAISSKINDYHMTLTNTGAIEGNFNRWPVLGSYVWPNNFIGNTHEEEETYFRDWITDRVAWLDTAINGL